MNTAASAATSPAPVIQPDRKVRVYIDFDGTISTEDIGEQIFRVLGDSNRVDEILIAMNNQSMSTTEGWRRLLETLPPMNEERLRIFVLQYSLDPAFKEFLQFAAGRNFECAILSDGMDFYIRLLLEREGITNIPVFSNHLVFRDDGAMKLEFSLQDEECRLCAHCKRNRVVITSADEDYTVYIGNGHSDMCAAQYCDFIFAKDALLKFCEKERIPFSPYRNFKDVKEKLAVITNKRRLKKRHQAELKRRALYMRG
mgnify:FL=1